MQESMLGKKGRVISGVKCEYDASGDLELIRVVRSASANAKKGAAARWSKKKKAT